jgi:hypothetical protein
MKRIIARESLMTHGTGGGSGIPKVPERVTLPAFGDALVLRAPPNETPQIGPCYRRRCSGPALGSSADGKGEKGIDGSLERAGASLHLCE